jgi:MerR family transcriptional regulator, light-induced transcriptional regulator
VTAEEVRQRYLDAILQGSRREAFGVIELARTEGLGIRPLYLEVFQPAMREIGRLWQENRITVADEHLATAITQAAMARLYEDLFRASPQPGPLLVAACADQERHELGLRMICDVLEMEGWDTVFLGASVPVEDLVQMVRARHPQVVALSASIAPHVGRVREAIRAIREAEPQPAPLIAVGGRAFVDDPALAERLGADLTAKDAVEAAELLKEKFAA